MQNISECGITAFQMKMFDDDILKFSSILSDPIVSFPATPLFCLTFLATAMMLLGHKSLRVLDAGHLYH